MTEINAFANQIIKIDIVIQIWNTFTFKAHSPVTEQQWSTTRWQGITAVLFGMSFSLFDHFINL